MALGCVESLAPSPIALRGEIGIIEIVPVLVIVLVSVVVRLAASVFVWILGASGGTVEFSLGVFVVLLLLLLVSLVLSSLFLPLILLHHHLLIFTARESRPRKPVPHIAGPPGHHDRP